MQEIVAHEDIYAANGMKLLAKGARIDRSTWEHLTAHKLKAPLDMLLVSSGTMDQVALAGEADRLFASDPLLVRLGTRSGDPLGFKFTLGRLSLPHPVAFRLTVMHADRQPLFQHSLRTAVIAHFLGIQLKLSETQKDDLLLAALCHDLGEMHTDPALLANGRRIDGEERRFIHVHPITGYVVLQELKAASPDVLQAVLQHHERLDGSGYPYGLADTKVGRLARIIAVSETLEAVTRRFDLARLDVILRLNQKRLDAVVVKALRELLQSELHATEHASQETNAAHRLLRLSDILQKWETIGKRIENESANEPLRFLADRMSMLHSLTLQAGIYPDSAAVLDLASHDTGVLDELLATLGEIDRLLDEFAFEIERRTEAHVECQGMALELVQLMRSG
jgi:HD-GYP domain-containing protein (c-di-GMP phosphodiesterase class II)